MPTSCRQKASARSASSRSPRAWSCSRRARAPESHLTRRLSAVLPGRVDGGDGRVAATRCAAGRCASSGTRYGLPGQRRAAAARSGGHPRRRSHPARRRRDRPLDRADSRPRDGPRHHDDRAAAVRSGNGRADRRLVVRESAALRRLGRDVAHPVRHGASRQAADAHARRLSDARDRGVSRRSADRSTRWSSSATRRCATCSSGRACTRSARIPYRSITEIEMAEGKRDDDQPDDDRATRAAADSSERRACTARRSSAATSAPTPPRACWPSTSRTRSGSSRSWTSARTPS